MLKVIINGEIKGRKNACKLTINHDIIILQRIGRKVVNSIHWFVMVHYFPFLSYFAIDTKSCAQNLYNHDLQISYDARKGGWFTILNAKDTLVRYVFIYVLIPFLLPKSYIWKYHIIWHRSYYIVTIIDTITPFGVIVYIRAGFHHWRKPV